MKPSLFEFLWLQIHGRATTTQGIIEASFCILHTLLCHYYHWLLARNRTTILRCTEKKKA